MMKIYKGNPKKTILDESFNRLDKDGVKEMCKYLFYTKNRERRYFSARTRQKISWYCTRLYAKWIRSDLIRWCISLLNI